MSLVGLHHIHLRVPDLEASRAFVADFGLTEVAEIAGRRYFRGCGPAAYLVVLEAAAAPSLAALAFEVDSPADLDRAVERHGAVRVQLDGPHGGQAVALVDPEGNTIHLVHGIEQRQAAELRPGLVYNFGHEKPRRGASQSVAPLGPPQILRLGHVGMFARDARKCAEWFGQVLGLIPSDIMYGGTPDNVVAGFYRIDRGDEWVDHHTLALFGMGKTDVHHISFEVQDSEVQFMAHRWLARQGHDSVWGVGRHPKGSHIFDVWRDPSGYRFETFSDTDLCTADRPVDVFPIDQAEMDMWSDRNFQAYFA
jgi:catechol 2,3-dioxygenase-like lactoylglutathione lyase family enzyme